MRLVSEASLYESTVPSCKILNRVHGDLQASSGCTDVELNIKDVPTIS